MALVFARDTVVKSLPFSASAFRGRSAGCQRSLLLRSTRIIICQRCSALRQKQPFRICLFITEGLFCFAFFLIDFHIRLLATFDQVLVTPSDPVSHLPFFVKGAKTDEKQGGPRALPERGRSRPDDCLFLPEDENLGL